MAIDCCCGIYYIVCRGSGKKEVTLGSRRREIGIVSEFGVDHARRITADVARRGGGMFKATMMVQSVVRRVGALRSAFGCGGRSYVCDQDNVAWRISPSSAKQSGLYKLSICRRVKTAHCSPRLPF